MEIIHQYSNSTIHSSWLPILTDPVRLAILRTLCELGIASATELRKRTHTSDRSLRRHLEALVALGVVGEREGFSDGLTPGRPACHYAVDAGVGERIDELFSVLGRPLAP